MRLFILGATGGIGGELVKQGIQRGYEVTAFARAPEKLPLRHERLAAIPGDPRDAEQMKKALSGHDAVLSALGHRRGGSATILGECARATVSAMQQTGVQRLLVVSVAFLFPDSGLPAALLRNVFLRANGVDSREMERALSESGLDWTIVRPPRLTSGPCTGRYRVEEGHLLEATIGTTTLLGGVQRLAERAGPSRAREIIYTAEQYDAATFERWNIVNRVLPDDTFESQTRAFAERLANGPTLAYAAGKRIVRAYLESGVRAADRVVDEVAPPLFQSEDMRAGVAALVEHGARNFRDKVIFQGR